MRSTHYTKSPKKLHSKYIVATMYFENKQGNSDEEEPRKNTLANWTGRYLPKSRESVNISQFRTGFNWQ